MKRSRVQSLTALASVTLLMILLGSPAQAAPWQLATDGWLGAAGWFENVWSWLTGAAPKGDTRKPAASVIEKGTAKGGENGVRPATDEGVCLDPGGNRIPCVS